VKNNSLLNDQVPERRGKLQGQSGIDTTENKFVSMQTHKT